MFLAFQLRIWGVGRNLSVRQSTSVHTVINELGALNGLTGGLLSKVIVLQGNYAQTRVGNYVRGGTYHVYIKMLMY